MMMLDTLPIQMKSVETDLRTVTAAILDASSEKDSMEDLKKFVPRMITRIYALREMYFMHFSRHSRQQWQHFMPHFTSGLPDWLFLNRLSM